MKIFNLDSPFMMFLTKVANLMILTVLTLLCFIPVITGGAAVTALYYVSLKLARGEDPYIVKSYFKSFKENFLQATILWILMLAVAGLIAVDWSIIIHTMVGQSARIMSIVMLVISALLLMAALYVFPMLSRFENTVWRTIKNAFLMSIMNFPKSILILVIHLIPIAVLLISQALVPVVFFMGLGVISYLCSLLFVKMFKPFEPEQEENTENPDELAPLSFLMEEEEKEKQESAPVQEDAAKAAEEPEQGE